MYNSKVGVPQSSDDKLFMNKKRAMLYALTVCFLQTKVFAQEMRGTMAFKVK